LRVELWITIVRSVGTRSIGFRLVHLFSFIASATQRIIVFR
jgi:hypothetical protein